MLALGHHEDRTPTHGYAATREAAMAAGVVQLKPETEVEATSILPSLNGKTARSWRGIVLFTHLAREGAYDSRYRTAGIVGRTRRRGDVAARGARAGSIQAAAHRLSRHQRQSGRGTLLRWLLARYARARLRFTLRLWLRGPLCRQRSCPTASEELVRLKPDVVVA